MEITYLGNNCIRLKGKQSSIIIDPNPAHPGIGKVEADIVAITDSTKDTSSVIKSENLVLNGPGEYEITGIHIVGTAQKSQNPSLDKKVTAFLVNVDNVNCLHVGSFTQTKLDEDQMEDLANVDVIFVPVYPEGSGMSASSAVKLASSVEATVVIPLFPGGNEDTLLSAFLKELGKESLEKTKKYVITKEKLPEEPVALQLEVA